MFEVGRLCVKVAGRDARKKAVITEVLDDNYVMVDGEVRRKKCSIKHLEPLDQVIEINDKASHEDVVKAFSDLGIELRNKKSKETKERPKKTRAKKSEPAKTTKKSTKKTTKKA